MGNNISNNIFNNITNINKLDPVTLQTLINDKNYILINTLSENNQNCLINKTILAKNEVNIINNYLSNNKSINIIIYGKNSYDDSILKKYFQLKNLGFKNLYIYIGGLFEWLLLQQIYGDDEFKTTSKIYDILQYK